MAPDRFSLLLYRTCLAGCLLGGVATLYFVGGLAGYLQHPVFNLAAVGGVFVAALFFLYVFFATMPQRSRLGFSVWSLTLLILLVQVALGFLPPTARDELTHHLALPRLYAAAGRIFEVPFAPYSYYPMLLDMLYTPWVQWGWDFVPKLIHGLFGYLTALLLYAYLAHRLNPLYGLLGFFIFIFTPAILRLSHWGYVDLGMTFFSTAALLCLLRRGEDQKWLALGGLLAGFAIATKPNGLLVLLLLFWFLPFILGGEERNGRGLARDVALFLLLTLIPVFPWFLKNLVWTGNPVFPLFTNLLGGEDGGGGSGLGIFTKREFFYGESWWQIAALPLRVFFVGRDDQPQYFDGVLNPMLILFLPWAFKGKWLEEKKLFFAFALFYLLFAVFLTELRIRYILPIVPPLVILLVYGIHNIYLRVAHPPVLYATVIVLLALNGVYLGMDVRAASPEKYLLGQESREAYLSRMLTEYPAIQYINQHLPATAKIYFLFVGRRVYYCERSWFHDSGEYPTLFFHSIRGAHNGEEVEARLHEKGLTHLLLRVDLFLRFLAENFSQQDGEMWSQFQARHLRLLFEEGGYAVYEIRNGA